MSNAIIITIAIVLAVFLLWVFYNMIKSAFADHKNRDKSRLAESWAEGDEKSSGGWIRVVFWIFLISIISRGCSYLVNGVSQEEIRNVKEEVEKISAAIDLLETPPYEDNCNIMVYTDLAIVVKRFCTSVGIFWREFTTVDFEIFEEETDIEQPEQKDYKNLEVINEYMGQLDEQLEKISHFEETMNLLVVASDVYIEEIERIYKANPGSFYSKFVESEKKDIAEIKESEDFVTLYSIIDATKGFIDSNRNLMIFVREKQDSISIEEESFYLETDEQVEEFNALQVISVEKAKIFLKEIESSDF